MKGCIQAISQVRKDVEEALSKATLENPVTAEQIAKNTGHDSAQIRTHIGGSVRRGLAHNLRIGKVGAGLYVAGKAPKIHVESMPEPRTAPPSGLYKPAPWTPPREASDQHEKCNSVWNGEVTPYTRPFSNAGRALEPIGHGGLKFA